MESKLLTLYSDVESEPVRWLWYPYIAVGKITLLQGDPGDGKSTMMMNLIAELSKGGATPDGKTLGRPRQVIYQCSEDGANDTIKPRLEACGADCRNIAFISAVTQYDRKCFLGRKAGFFILYITSTTCGEINIHRSEEVRDGR